MTSPTFHLLYFKNILDLVVAKFFDDFNDSFVREDEKYVLGKDFSKSRLEKLFLDYSVRTISEIVHPYDVFNPEYYIIIGACQPCDNMLLKISGSQKNFPAKLRSVLSEHPDIKYVLKEDDIEIDSALFNSVFISVFKKLFKSKRVILRRLGETYKNVIFVSHKNLDCYMMFKTVKFLIGASNCVNEFTSKMSGVSLPIVAVNELISKYATGRSLLNSLPEFKTAVEEVKEYLTKSIEHVIGA